MQFKLKAECVIAADLMNVARLIHLIPRIGDDFPEPVQYSSAAVIHKARGSLNNRLDITVMITVRRYVIALREARAVFIKTVL
jgi:hypothetical protein